MCTREKLEILRASLDPNSLNKRSEMVNKCRHRAKFLLASVQTRGCRRKENTQEVMPQSTDAQEDEIVTALHNGEVQEDYQDVAGHLEEMQEVGGHAEESQDTADGPQISCCHLYRPEVAEERKLLKK